MNRLARVGGVGGVGGVSAALAPPACCSEILAPNFEMRPPTSLEPAASPATLEQRAFTASDRLANPYVVVSKLPIAQISVPP